MRLGNGRKAGGAELEPVSQCPRPKGGSSDPGVGVGHTARQGTSHTELWGLEDAFRHLFCLEEKSPASLEAAGML